MEKKFTPGPWFSVEYGGFYNIQDGPYYEDKVVTDLEKDENAAANSQLASCAPEMFNLLQYFLMNEYCGDHREEVEKLLIKATTVKP